MVTVIGLADLKFVNFAEIKPGDPFKYFECHYIKIGDKSGFCIENYNVDGFTAKEKVLPIKLTIKVELADEVSYQ